VALSQIYAGRKRYYTDHETPTGKLTVSVEYQVEEHLVLAFLDTGASCGIFPASLADALGYDAQAEGLPTALHTRLGDYDGYLLRIPIFIPAEEGEGLEVELTWVVSPSWPGPPTIGWGGCLERIRFALDPTPGEDCFYFGPTSDSSSQT
jgi:hypothetical protein